MKRSKPGMRHAAPDDGRPLVLEPGESAIIFSDTRPPRAVMAKTAPGTPEGLCPTSAQWVAAILAALQDEKMRKSIEDHWSAVVGAMRAAKVLQ